MPDDPAAVFRSAPELLAPAGDWDCVRAAIENGADAVYFGLDTGFNARARATNFTLADLPRLMEMLHLRGLKGYATLNTLVFSDEVEAFGHTVAAVADAGVDAVLVQDVGVARLIRERLPHLPLHASTQMTLTSAETIALAEELGMARVVTLDRRDHGDPPADGDAARGVRARGALRGLFRAVPDERVARRP